MRSTLRPLAAEFLGTFIFVLAGAGAVVVNAARTGALGLGAIAFVHAVALAVMVTVTLPISGGHLNPAVTFAVWMAGRIDLRRACLYIATQLVAAVLAALCLGPLFPTGAAASASYGIPRLSQDMTMTQSVLLEAVLTLMLVSAVFGTAVSRHAPRVGGFAIGLVFLVGVFIAGPLTGGALNPARAFGPALVALDWHGHLAYWIGPLLGAAVAALLWAKLLLPIAGDPEP